MALISGQLNIAIGSPNSPTNSDSLYTAFGKIQNNFTNVFNEASSFTTANISTGNGLSSEVVAGTITLENTGVISIQVVGNNLSTTAYSNGVVDLGLANSISGLNTISTGNLLATSIQTSSVQSANIQTTNIVAVANISAGTVTSGTSTTVGTFLKLTPIASPPPSPTQGTVYYDSFINMLRVYNGTSWGNVALV